MPFLSKSVHFRDFGDFRTSWILTGEAVGAILKALGRIWILPALAGLRVGQRKVVLTRSTAEGVGGFSGCPSFCRL